MKKNNKNSRIALLAMLTLPFLTSCNRGVGCPNKFSGDIDFTEMIFSLVQLFI